MCFAERSTYSIRKIIPGNATRVGLAERRNNARNIGDGGQYHSAALSSVAVAPSSDDAVIELLLLLLVVFVWDVRAEAAEVIFF